MHNYLEYYKQASDIRAQAIRDILDKHKDVLLKEDPDKVKGLEDVEHKSLFLKGKKSLADRGLTKEPHPWLKDEGAAFEVSLDDLWNQYTRNRIPYKKTEGTARRFQVGEFKRPTGYPGDIFLEDGLIGMDKQYIDTLEMTKNTPELEALIDHPLTDLLSHSLSIQAGYPGEDGPRKLDEDHALDRKNRETIVKRIKNTLLGRRVKHDAMTKSVIESSPFFKTSVFEGINAARAVTGKPLDKPEDIYDYLTFLEGEHETDPIQYYYSAPGQGKLFRALRILNKKRPETAEKLKRAIAFQGAQI